MPVTYTKCGTDVNEIVAEMIEKHHPELKQSEAKICVLFAHAPVDAMGIPTSDAVTVGGYPCAAKVKIIKLKERVDGRADAEIVIDAREWEEITDERKAALIDHELLHIWVQVNPVGIPELDDIGRPKMKLRKHDHQFGWFDAIAKRHGDDSYEVSQARLLSDKYGQLYFGWESPPKRGQSVKNGMTAA